MDERGAAFFALGISKATNEHVAVICTSGTAVANYAPAALEAFHGANKLLLITADRPSRLRKTGANQTTDQVNIFKGIKTHDLNSFEPIELIPGPIHLNLQFDEPLLPSNSEDWLKGIHHVDRKTSITPKEKLSVSGNGVVIVGHDKGGFNAGEIEEFASNLLVISEDPLSFKEAIPHASIFLADEKVREFLKADYVIVIGRTTLSRSINAYISMAGKQYVIDKRIKSVDTNRSADKLFENLPELDIQDISESYRRDFETASKNSVQQLEWSEQAFAKVFAEALPEGAALFIGSSRPIRDIEGFAASRNGISVFANRGLAGIDGNISTVFGLSEYFDKTYAVLGDLTFLHDISALVSPTSNANCKIFVIDNNGGGIFSTLPQAGVNGFDKIFGTPHGKDLVKIVEGFGIKIEVIKGESDLKRAINHQNSQLTIYLIEVPNREEMANNLKEYYAKASNAVRIGFNLA
jgi:2-succinyl-5-enolpyruvyl-6-hydroxy-3-cyclohexene-1-carboxylate synthase